MRHIVLSLLGVAVIVLATSVVAQYQYGARWMYTSPRVVQYPTQACKMVYADPGSDSCYADGFSLCRGQNSGFCFCQCAQNVFTTCRGQYFIYKTGFPSCPLDPGFEHAFASRGGCGQACP